MMTCKGCGTPPGVMVDPVTFAPHCIKCKGIITLSVNAVTAPAQQAQYVIYNIPISNANLQQNLQSNANLQQNLQITGAAPSVGYTIAGGLGSLGAGIDSLTTPEKKETPEEAYDRAMGVIK